MEFNSSDRSHQERVESLLKENQRLLIENNTLLRAMRRTAFLSSLFRFVWFMVILGAIYYVYTVHLKPNLESIKQRTAELQVLVPDQERIKELYDEIRAKEAVTE